MNHPAGFGSENKLCKCSFPAKSSTLKKQKVRQRYVATLTQPQYNTVEGSVSAVSRVVTENRVLLVSEVLIHFCFEHLLDGYGKEALQLLPDVACGLAL